MRYRDVPQLAGVTDPLGTISSPLDGWGKIPALRLAASEPELIGQDPIPYLETSGFDSIGPSKPDPSPVPKPTTGPIRPGAPRPSGPRPGGGPTLPPFLRSGRNFGAMVVAGNNYGALGQIIEQKRANPVTAITDVIETFRQSGKQAGLDTAASISVREGVPVTEAALEVISTRKMGAQELQRRIAGVKAELRSARARKQRTKAKKLAVRLAALQARLRDVQSGKKQAIADDKAIAGDSTRIAPWITYASLAVGVAGLFVALYGIAGKKK